MISSDNGMRLLGVLPLLFFAGMVWTHWRKGKISECLWMCHVSNLLLAAGMLFRQPILIQATAPWLILGVPLWVLDMLFSRSLIPASVVSHAGGTAVGLFALHHVGARPSMWISSFVFYLAMQPVSRWLTPRHLNVNLSQRTYDEVKDYFPNFGVFWISATGLAAVILWGLSYILNRCF